MSKRILVIDDEVQLVAMITLRLESAGFEVASAFDGEVGMEKLKGGGIDLVILDIGMPKKDGYTFIKEVRACEAIKDVPVIVLTGKDRMQDMFEAEGIKDYLVKPFETDELLSKINSYFK